MNKTGEDADRVVELLYELCNELKGFKANERTASVCACICTILASCSKGKISAFGMLEVCKQEIGRC